ncbi:MAG: hypothetical protein LBB83_09430 [Treponema sp.]|jgi:hypothetical protein|nr:hypothetical protein [Treponema sp.]
MIYFFNKGLIIETEICKALQTYFKSLGVENQYKNYTLNITNEHPWARLLMNGGDSEAASLFPAIIVASESDRHTPNNGHPMAEIEPMKLEPGDLDHLVEHGYSIDESVIEKLQAEFKNRKHLYGITRIFRRSERISFEIWAENIELKNLLYEDLRLFAQGAMQDYLDPYVHKNNLVIFDETINGQRSGTFTDSYGIVLAGANITVEADYMIEQSIIDTDLIDINNPVNVEVKYGHEE